MSRTRAIAALLLAIGVVAVIFVFTRPQGEQPQQDDSEAAGSRDATAPATGENEPTITIDLMRTAIEAVAAAENLDFDRSLARWAELAGRFPNNPSIRINQAVTALKWIEETHNLLTSGRIEDADQEQQLTADLAAAYQLAESIIQSLHELDVKDYRAALLEAELLRSKALRTDPRQATELRRQAVEVVADALRQDPAQPLLAASFDDMAQEFLASDPELVELQADALYASYKAMPRNLFLLFRACDTLLRKQDARLAELLDATLELTQPMRGDVANYLRRLDPEQTVRDVKEAITAGDWNSARTLIRWINLFKGMSGFKADRRLVQPDLMALLDVTFLDELAEQLPPVPADSATPTLKPVQAFEAERQAIVWYDFDLDLDFDAALSGADGVQLWRNDNGTLTLIQTIPLKFVPRGARAAELYPVDDPNRPRVDSVAALVTRDQPPGASAGDHQDAAGSPAPPADSPRAESESTGLASAEDIARANRHDTPQDLLVYGSGGIAILRPQVNAQKRVETLALADVQLPIDASNVLDLEVFDIESDGDLDILVSTDDGPRVLRNNGDQTFVDFTQYSRFDAGLQLVGLAAGDWDGDLDQDIVGVDRSSGELVMLENILHGQLRSVNLRDRGWQPPDGLHALAIADLDGNGAWDIVQADSQTVKITFALRTRDRTWRPGRSITLPIAARDVHVADVNNDGYQDVLIIAPNGIFVAAGDGQWAAAPQLVALHEAEGLQSIATADADADGRIEIAVWGASGGAIYATDVTDNNFLLARVRGIADDNGGGRINHFAIGSLLELRSGGWAARRVIRDPMTHFGVGRMTPDNLRIVFPNGLTQNVKHPQPNSLIEEKQELKGSCPFVYGWNGERFELITDLLWNAPLGLQIEPGVVLPDRRWEYLLLPGELVQPVEGRIELRVTEELWEVAYFDHVSLVAVDHPADTELFTNEKVGPPEIAEHRLFQVRSRGRRPLRAVDAAGRDWTEQVQAADDRYAQPFKRLICQGLAEPHYLELDFGELPIDRDLKLILRGWLYPTDTSLNMAIAQNSRLQPPEPCSLWVIGDDGQWECARPFMGFPGGKPKTIVVDLRGVFKSPDHRLRVASSQQIYWDRALVAWDTAPTEVKQHALALESAQLRYRGFSRLLPRAADQPHWYDYHDVDRRPRWPEIEGPFTRFGDVTPLLQEDDDRMVVMTSGDEIVLRFIPPASPPPNGWKRDYVLHSVGWDKDADLNTLAGQSSLPLPFQQQESYPPPPHQDEQARRTWQLNRDTLTRARQTGHDDWYLQ